MSIQLPAQPWEKDDTFTVEETGITFTYDGEKWLASAGESDDGLTDEEKARRLKAPLQYRGYLEMDADGKPIAPWDEVFLGENEFGVDRELGGWFGHSTAGFQYGNWDMRDCDWIWLVSDNLAEAYENNDYQAIDTAWKVTPKNVGDTFALEMLQVGLDAWEDDAGFYAFKGTHELEFRVEEIYWPEHPKGWSNTYAPMVRVSQVRDRDFYRYYLREKPEYNFDGDKAISVHLTNLIITNNDLYATKDDLEEAIEGIEFPEGVDLEPIEDRLDAIETVLPKAPLEIPNVDIDSGKVLIDHPTRPSGADKPPAEELWMWHMDADRTGNPANEMKTTVPSEYQGNVILDGINAVWFKQGDRVQKWNTSNGGWWTGGNLWHLSASSTEGDTLVDGQPFEIYYVDPNTTGDSFIDAISRAESKADDRRLQADLEEIALILSTLSNSIENGFYEYVGNSVPTQPGQFSLAFPDVTTAENIITFNEKDADGTTHNLPATVSVDDYLEIVDQEHPEQFGLWQVTAVPDGTGIFSVQAKLVKAGETFDGNDRCEVRFFSTTDALDVNELDARYLQIKDANFVSKTGGDEMQGPFKITNNPDLNTRDARKIEVLDIKSGSDNSSLNLGAKNTSIYVGENQTTFIKPVLMLELGGKDGNPVKLLNEGVEDDHLVSKGYVDGAVKSGIEGIELPETDLSGYATEGWVTEQIEAIEIPEPDLSDYVSTVDGNQSMKGPLEIHSLGAWAASRVKLEYVTSRSDTETLKLGAPSADDMLSVYKDKVNIKGPFPIRVREIQGSNGAGGTKYTGEYTDDDHIATKKDVEAAVENIDTGSGFTPGDQVAKVGSSSTNTGAFWIVDGALYCKVN